MAISIPSFGSAVSSAASPADSLGEWAGGGDKKRGSIEDKVSISQEARELSSEIRARQGRKYLTNEAETAFAKVATALPNTAGFKDMLSWMAAWSKLDNETVSLSAKTKEIDRNAYVKDPGKYVKMWEKLFDNYNGMIKGLQLDPQIAANRDLVKQNNVLAKAKTRFISALDADAKKLLNMFNVQRR